MALCITSVPSVYLEVVGRHGGVALVGLEVGDLVHGFGRVIVAMHNHAYGNSAHITNKPVVDGQARVAVVDSLASIAAGPKMYVRQYDTPTAVLNPKRNPVIAVRVGRFGAIPLINAVLELLSRTRQPSVNGLGGNVVNPTSGDLNGVIVVLHPPYHLHEFIPVMLTACCQVPPHRTGWVNPHDPLRRGNAMPRLSVVSGFAPVR